MRKFRKVLSILIVGILAFGTLTVYAAELDASKGVTDYDLWLGSTQVTSSNCNNILGDNTASFNPSNNTLTLNNPTRIDYYQDFMIASKLDELTVKGTYKMSGSNKTIYGIFSEENLILDGNFEFIATDCAILAQGDLTLKSGTIKANAVGATGVNDATGIACGGVFTVENGITKVETKGAFAGIESTEYSFGSTVDVTTPANYEFKHPIGYGGTFVYAEGGSAPATNVVIGQAGSTTIHYNVWVGDKEITSRNRTNILGDGKASFDPETNTLTLNNPTISGSYTSASNENTFKIFSENTNLTLKGSYTMNSAECYGGIRSKKSLTLDGDFKFMGTDFVVSVENLLTVKSGTLTVVSNGENAIGINAGTLIISNTITKFDVKAYICASARNIQVGDDLKFTTPEDGTIGQEQNTGYQFFCDSNGNTLQHVVIEPKNETPTVSYNLVLGNVPVTNKNKDDILNDGGKAKYNPDTKTLTLNNPTISGYFTYNSNNYKILAMDDVTVEGSYTMPQEITIYTGLYGDKTITLKGDFSFNGSYTAVNAKGDITVSSGSLQASSSSASSIALYSMSGNIIVNNGVTKTDLSGGYIAALGKNINLGDEMEITSPSGAQIVDVSGQDLQTIIVPPSTICKSVVIEPAPVVPPVKTYNVWLGEKQVDENNKDDILNDGGKAKYDPDTKTLTLSDPQISGSHSYTSNNYKIFTLDDITIEGSYSMPQDASIYAGLYGDKTVTLKGDFAFGGSVSGVRAQGDITVASGSLKASGSSKSSYAIYSTAGNIIINNEITRVQADSGYVAVVGKTITLGSEMEISSPEDAEIVDVSNQDYQTIAVYPGTIAVNVVIEPKKADDTDDSDNTDTTTDTTTDTSTDTSSNSDDSDDTDVSYSLWIGSTQVTSKNKDDILGDGGKAKFDPKTNTLTLADPVINNNYTDSNATNESKIYCKEIDLTVKGSYHIEQADANCGIRVFHGSLTLSGDFTLKGKIYGIVASNDVTIASGNIKAFANMWNGVAANHGKLIIKNEIECFEAKGETSPALVAENGIELDSDLYAEVPENGALDSAKHVIIKHKPVVKYNLWIGSTQVDSRNKDDILNDGGKAKYDPSTKTLTLDNPTVTGTVLDDTGWNDCNIRASKINLTVKGSYHMTECVSSFGIYVDEGSLTLDGDFTFIGAYAGMYSEYNLTLASGTIKAFGHPDGPVREGIFTNGKFIVEDGITRVESQSYRSSGICADSGMELNHNVIIDPVGGRVAPYFDDEPDDDPNGMKKIVNADGTSAEKVVIVNIANVFEGEGTEESPYLINDKYDWECLALFVSAGYNTSDMHFKLTDNIEASTLIGTEEHPFTGIFDGDGHTMTLNLESDGYFCAPFSYISGATIKNLKTDGTVKGDMHCSGLVGSAGSENLIENCEVSAEIICDKTHCGGILGHGGTSATTITDCVFSGKLEGEESKNFATIWGWSDNGSTPVIKNCLDVSESPFPIAAGEPKNSPVINSYYTNPDKQEAANRGWEDNGKLAYVVEGIDVEIKLNGETGLMYNGDLYAAEGEQIIIELPHADGLYIFSSGNADRDGNTVTFTMPAENVKVLTLSSISVEELPAKTDYYTGEALDASGIKIKLDYSDGSSEIIAEGFELSGFDSGAAGEKTVTVTYWGKTAEFKVAVKDNPLIKLLITEQPEKTEYYIGEKLDATGLKLEAEYENGTKEALTEGFELSEFDSSTAGEKTIAVTYKGKTVEFTVTVKSNKLTALTIVEQPEKTVYYIGEELDLTGLKLKAEYEDGTEKTITEGFETSGFDTKTEGEQTITVTYQGMTAEFKVTVKKMILLGDVNGDGEVTILDAVYIQKYLAEIPDKDFNISAADVTEDGTVTLIDVVYIQRWLAKLPCSDKIGQPM
ncbi:MAG: bacterial Ig-like domain-containing protein [Clostridiales bacterium]|nr:bacterial Ig-like domain-containing protein [Clostridiales bacterium]